MMNRTNIFALCCVLFSSGVVVSQQVKDVNFAVIEPDDTHEMIIAKAAVLRPTPQQMQWQEMECTGFIHFGMNTMTGREWGLGNEDPKLFDPKGLDAEQWVRSLKDAGMKMAILTAKHHDGFCLWPSAYTEHSVKNSPWKHGKGDVVREFVDACRKYGLKVGLYLSPWDRNNPSYGDSPKYNEFYRNQLTELLTQYGRIDEVWFDGACGEGPNGKKQVYDWQSYYRVIRALQPNAVIFGMSPDVRWVGTETGYGRETEWSVIPIEVAGVKTNETYPIDELYHPHDYVGNDLGSREKITAAKGLLWYPAEADVSIRPGWFYHANEDDSVKSIEKLLDIFYGSVGRNCVLLVNVPPDKNGLLNRHDVDTLKKLGSILSKTFKKNLAAGSTIVTAPGAASVPYKTVFTGSSSWNAPRGETQGIVECILPKRTTFDIVELQENIAQGQRIEQFTMEYHHNGKWIAFTKGTTIGYKRLLRFAPVTAERVRLIVERSRLNPSITSFGLYHSSR